MQDNREKKGRDCMHDLTSHELIRSFSQGKKDELLRLTSDLVSIPSVTGNEGEIAHFIHAKMQQLGFDEVAIDDYGSVIGRVGNGARKILFDAHCDTVLVRDATEWSTAPFSGEVKEGKLYGRGASDMKAALATAIYASAALKELELLDGLSVYVSATTLEEDYDGETLYHICEKIKPDYAIICEPSTNRVVLGQMGRAVLRIDLPGIAAHGSAPEKGVNAIYKATEIIKRIEVLAYELHVKKQGSLALTKIESEAVSLNAIPTRCSLFLDRRLVISQDYAYINAEMQTLLEGTKASWSVHQAEGVAWTGKKVQLHSFLPAWEIDEDHKLTKAFYDTYQKLFGETAIPRRWDFSTNGVATVKLGIPTIGFGPGDDKLAHMRDEYVEVAQLLPAMLFYASVTLQLR
jgi:putative selenium metabolism hydrolase